MTASIDEAALSRRQFLVRSGWVATGVTVLSGCSLIPAMPELDDPAAEDGLAWLQALPDGRIRFYCPRMEMGQGASLGLVQVAAEELNVDQADIDCVLANTDKTPTFKMTVGSESVFAFFEPVSYGAAHLREALRRRAAEASGQPLKHVRDDRGGFRLEGGESVAYADLAPSAPLILMASSIDENASRPQRYARTRRGAYQAIGKSWKHHDLEAIVTGRAVYSRDVTLPDMMFGACVRPPAFGAELLDVDVEAARSIDGVAEVVVQKDGGFIGVVADNPFTLPAAIDAVRATWSTPPNANQADIEASLDVERYRDRDDFEHALIEDGDIQAGQQRAKVEIAARYDTPFACHAAMEPRAGVASVTNDKVEIWCGSQAPFFIQRQVAKRLGRSERDVVVHPLRMGGGFGGRVFCQPAGEAAILSAAVGRPVRVQWDREAEFQNNYYQTAFSHHIAAGVSDDGRISHWDHGFVAAPITTGPFPDHIAWALDLLIADDDGTARDSVPRYRLPNRRIRYADVRTKAPVGAWRGLGAAPNVFAIEVMMDELAHAAGIDPLRFRLNHLPGGDDRLASVLERVAEIAGWRRDAPPGVGRGLACGAYKGLTPVAVIAEVEVDHPRRRLAVSKLWAAQDCGLIVNPDQVESLVMGNLVWGCGMALKEKMTFQAGRSEQRNFDSYELLRHDETPAMTVALMDSNEPPVGVGEAALPPVAPAIANAVFAATGERVRRLPISYDMVATA